MTEAEDGDGGAIVGMIRPDPKGGNAPLFRVIRKRDNPEYQHHEVPDAEAPDVRPCAHPRFILDERWMTVTCGECKAKIEPFAAIMVYADWWERHKQQAMMAQMAERRLYIAELRRLSRLRGLTDDERKEVRAAIDNYRLTTEEVRDLARRTEKTYNQRRNANA
jgi:hypothetical protein